MDGRSTGVTVTVRHRRPKTQRCAGGTRREFIEAVNFTIEIDWRLDKEPERGRRAGDTTGFHCSFAGLLCSSERRV